MPEDADASAFRLGDGERARSTGESIRIRGLVQGVGFRPTVWRLARECGLKGDVRNDGLGVLARVVGDTPAIDRFCRLLLAQPPPLARIDTLERLPLDSALSPRDFRILDSDAGPVRTGVVADAATCEPCRAEILDPANRRYRYAFTNCTHCGPRLSIIDAIPYDRANTSMALFPMCSQCRSEYDDPGNRRFHAQPNACPLCGPRVWLEDARGAETTCDDWDAIHSASRLLARGNILAIKGIGGFHLACNARNEEAVSRLRNRKRRPHKPFALMARDLEIVRRYCSVSEAEAGLLKGAAGPVVLLSLRGREQVAAGIAPDQANLGFMLPHSPLHHLLLADWEGPLVMTSGNLSEEPQCIDNEDARERLSSVADYLLMHDRAIVNRVDDSVARVMGGEVRLVRRARGYAPAPLPLPVGFEAAPPILALGGELKNNFCLLKDGQALLSQHLGDLREARTADEQRRTIALYRRLFEHEPQLIAADLHPDYRTTHLGLELAEREELPLIQVQHHFAHIASVLADNNRAMDAPPVVGVALDGLGFGADGSLWGTELLLADYRSYRRLAHLKYAPMPGGAKAILEPWRNTFAHLATHIGWTQVQATYPRLPITEFLEKQPLHILSAMIRHDVNSPLSSSCGRLFDAVAAALDVCREAVSYEGQAAIELESLASTYREPEHPGYKLAVDRRREPFQIDPAPMWQALLSDLARGESRADLAARFHRGLATTLTTLAIALARRHGADAIALSGGVMQNKTLFELICRRLERAGMAVLTHRQVPANDGGVSLGQAAIAAATAIERSRMTATKG